MTRKETRGRKYHQKLRKALEQKRVHSSRGSQFQRIRVLGQCTVLKEYMCNDIIACYTAIFAKFLWYKVNSFAYVINIF